MRARSAKVVALRDGDHLIRQCSRTWRMSALAELVTCEWSARLCRSLGRAYPSQMRIRLSTLLQVPPYDALFSEVVCHELAHLAVYRRYGRHGATHGAEWKRFVESAGFEPRRFATIADRTRRVNSSCWYEHVCPVCHASRRARRPQRRWRCAACELAGLAGKLIIRSVPHRLEVRNG